MRFADEEWEMPICDKGGAAQRAAPRIKIFQPAEMACASGAPLRVHLLNISAGGALVYAPKVPAVGEHVQLHCGVALGSARVQWAGGNRFGVKFADPIGPGELEAILGSSQVPACA
jgi:hypothetical protein